MRLRAVAVAAAVVAVALVGATCTTTHPTAPSARESPNLTLFAASRGTWRPMAPAPISAGDGESVAWTGREAIVCCAIHGDLAATGPKTASAAAYDPETDTWHGLPDPPPLFATTSIWTGTDDIVIGTLLTATAVNLALVAYNPAHNTWRALPSPPIQSAAFPAAVWTGRDLIALSRSETSAGGFDTFTWRPGRRAWRQIASAPSGVFAGERFWTGHELVVLDGQRQQEGAGPPSWSKTGAAYDPATDRWRRLADQTVAPPYGPSVMTLADGRVTAVYESVSQPPTVGGATLYDVEADRWSVTQSPPMFGRSFITSVAIGSLVGLVGGTNFVAGQAVDYADLTLFDPASGQWAGPVSAPLAGRSLPLVVWTGTELLVWGGSTQGGAHRQDGAVYAPTGMPPAPTTTATLPGDSGVTSAAGVDFVCGAALPYGGPSGAVIYDLDAHPTHPALPLPGPLTGLTGGGVLAFQVSDDCDHGADVTISPPGSYATVFRAVARDGRAVAVVLCPSQYVTSQLTASRGNQPIGHADIQVPIPPPGSPPNGRCS